MNRLARLTATLATLALTHAAVASEAQTSASAGSNRYARNGTATATASYEGDVGFARTDTRSGSVNLARGVAVGFDEDGLSLSISNAIAPRFGPAIATNFNLSIDTDGDVSASRGLAIASGPLSRTATAGGVTANGRGLLAPAASSFASGETDRHGRVIARTSAFSSPRPVIAPLLHRPVQAREVRSEVRRYFLARP